MLPNWMKPGADKARPRRASAKEGSASPDPQAAGRAKQRRAPGTPPVTERRSVSPVKTAESRSPNERRSIPPGQTGSPESSDRESESEGGPQQAPVLFAEPPVAGPILVCPL